VCCAGGRRGANGSCIPARGRRTRSTRCCSVGCRGKPPCSDLFGVTGRQWLAALELPLEERESVDAGIRQVEFLDAEIAAVERLIAQQALDWPEIRRLMTVPGVNLICAATLIAAVGRAGRFLSSSKLVAYIGLDPKVRQSGEAPRRAAGGSASAARWALVEAAWSVVYIPVRRTASVTARAPGAGMARRPSRPRASRRSCSGACSRAGRTMRTSSRR
jgi:transposase